MAVLPVIPNAPIKLGSLVEITRANLPSSNLIPGETLTVTVIEKLAPDQYLIAAKDGTLKATCELPFNVGDKIQVKVQTLEPQIVLNVQDTMQQGAYVKLNAKLLQWRVHPDSLVHLFSKLSELSVNLKSINLGGLVPKEADGLFKLFNGLVFSSRSKNNPLFVKNFVSKFGLLLESDLNTAASRSEKNIHFDGKIQDNLKAYLLKLSEALKQTLKDQKLDPQVLARLSTLSSWTSEALQVIEARQAVNVIYQQNESGLYLQIPMALGTVLRHADIFIRPDERNREGAKKYETCSIVIFLDLDHLGKISIDAFVKEGRLRCVIQCESEETTQLVSSSASKLNDALSGIGYGVDQIDCLKVSGLENKRNEYIDEHVIGSADLVNHFA